MKISIEFLRSRVARRVFTLFVISSLIPVTLLSLLAYGQVKALLTDEQYAAIKQSNKSYGLAVLERLLLLDSQLQWAERALSQDENGSQGREDAARTIAALQGFRRVEVFTRAQIEQGRSSPLSVRELIEREHAYLANDKAILLAAPQPRLSSRVYLLRMLKREDGPPAYVLGEIRPGFIFGERDTFSQGSQTCVLDEQNTPLFCSQMDYELSAEQLEALSHSTSGQFELTDAQGHEHLLSYWSIFLKPNFWVQKWTIISRAPASAALAPIMDFRLIFAGVIALTMAIVALLSVHQIRRSLIPLERILDGVRRITQRDFSRPVEVDSGDEFEVLANSVNQMAITIDKQFHTLSTLAEIDQLILSSLKADDIVRTVLTRTNEILRYDHISMTVMDTAGNAVCHTLAHDSHLRETLSTRSLQIEPADIAALALEQYLISDADAIRTAIYLESLAAQGARRALTLPVLVKEQVAALICIGYAQPIVIDREDIELARDLTNRVAVALANASWEEQLYHLAHYDTLTELPNRLLLKDRLHQALASAERQETFVAVLFIDLDRFKNVNDSLGHVAGDYLLREVGERLRHALREEDTVSRLGGDEFVVVIQASKNAHESLSLTSTMAQKLLSELARPLRLNDREIITTASIGIACYPTDGETANELLKNADAAMYHAKASGKDTYQFYSKILNAEALERLEMESSLRRALERNELELAYQPKYATQSKGICGAEALLRWTHPQRGPISPGAFIPLCEEIGLIVPIGDWVVREVCGQLNAWSDAGLAPIPVAINLSPVQFRQPDLIERLFKIVVETGVDPGLLEFEITEGATMENIALTTATLSHLQALGFHISIDDFGTGHSSLSYLKQFPINTLKVDQSFVRHLSENSKDAAIVKSIVTLAHSLGFTVVAEGVETQAQLDHLSGLGCDAIQGYLFSRPIPPQEFAGLLGSELMIQPALGDQRGSAGTSPITKAQARAANEPKALLDC
ncbi:EAL domain-containing protein [Thiorhodococcus mannitoliphagus]|uniref:cyclic-guanylate-specific phosphodiesterase n=1 Tax=Thiorhodococcus mannitoliphagus TaxID=329406 RepID=A0A6P1DXK6_9GAMM|nr:EAL domain-containing protein [Thiorhodococcus mannitoliphagus]NEX21721.1 EAL domain-containing protein [Thiorhodococcus mannitoliphagus]